MGSSPGLKFCAFCVNFGRNSQIGCGRRRRLDRTGEEAQDPCGLGAIVAACNEAFGVESCECVSHSEGGCEIADLNHNETAADSTFSATATSSPTAVETTDFNREGGASTATALLGGNSGLVAAAGSASAYIVVDSQGRMLEGTINDDVTTTLDIFFVTDIYVSWHSIISSVKFKRLESYDDGALHRERLGACFCYCLPSCIFSFRPCICRSLSVSIVTYRIAQMPRYPPPPQKSVWFQGTESTSESKQQEPRTSSSWELPRVSPMSST